MFTTPRIAFALACLAASTLACGDNGTAEEGLDTGPGSDTTATTMTVAIPFAAKVNGAAFACDAEYEHIGSTHAVIKGQDFRFYVSNLKLLPANGGAPVAITLDANANQGLGIALLDFENKTGACQMGTAATYTTVTGTVPTGLYKGLTFMMGVPFEHNHIDDAVAPVPLNEVGMNWNWRGGYKFLKFEGKVKIGDAFTQGYNLHLGSTTCNSAGDTIAPVAPCAQPNTVDVSLPDFVLGSHQVNTDAGALLAGEDVTADLGQAPGCMSGPGDQDCTPIFPKLGLAHGGAAAGPQQLFTQATLEK